MAPKRPSMCVALPSEGAPVESYVKHMKPARNYDTSPSQCNLSRPVRPINPQATALGSAMFWHVLEAITMPKQR